MDIKHERAGKLTAVTDHCYWGSVQAQRSNGVCSGLTLVLSPGLCCRQGERWRVHDTMSMFSEQESCKGCEAYPTAYPWSPPPPGCSVHSEGPSSVSRTGSGWGTPAITPTLQHADWSTPHDLPGRARTMLTIMRQL